MATWRLGALGTRLVIAFVAVAAVAIATVAVATLFVQRADVAQLAATSQRRTTAAMTSAFDNAYLARGGWAGTDLQPAVVLASAVGAEVELEGSDGAVLLRAGPVGLLGSSAAVRLTQPLVVGGRRVGLFHIAFPAGGLSPADKRFRSELGTGIAGAAVLAVLVALIIAVAITRVLVRPIRRLTAAAHTVEGGSKDWPGLEATGPGELGELSRSFKTMVAALERAERLRHAMVADVAPDLRKPVFATPLTRAFSGPG